jgi:hypothetical protein
MLFSANGSQASDRQRIPSRRWFAAQILNLIGRGGTGDITGQAALPGFHELLRSGVVQALGDPFLAASSEILSSPRRPSSTIRILSSAEKCRRVARRISFTTCSVGFLAIGDLALIFVPSSLRREPNSP